MWHTHNDVDVNVGYFKLEGVDKALHHEYV